MKSHCESSNGKTLLRGACYMCSAHGIEAYQRSHICPFSACECSYCKVIRVRRAVVARQLRMRREEKKLCDSSLRSYTCNRCRNHGLRVPKKGHKNECPFESCSCAMCTLCHSRSILDANFRRNTGRSMKKVSKSTSLELPTLDEEVISSRLSRVHSASPDHFSLITSTADITSIPIVLSLSNPFLVTSQSLSRIPSGIVPIPNPFDIENRCPGEQARVSFLLQSLPQSLQAFIRFNTRF
ncbi:hypothetical protein PRIPAC_87161 [Pristionchus pacificus]|uniref:Uncharacterized protein n=1 Tax=Pristionchus pacificus TaxID=54126 RepID=A0A2A6B3L9_PRIPA|nr:hypothetical protein PRIPAC_87161 [Pristionchus pacificus]|eukprot:PDM60451.1 hypothetical protein PRIPAC_53429 [Pristionchus pacificus]